MWNNQEYLSKMCEDTMFLLEYPNVSEWLGFSPTANPFLLPPEVLFEVCLTEVYIVGHSSLKRCVHIHHNVHTYHCH